FRLLCALGLRSRHTLLDFGCGSLRAGRFLLTYLDPGNYYGIEPNQWLIKTSIETEFGEDLVRIKRPHFDDNQDFRVPFDAKFDYILAQSIFSHTGTDLARQAIQNFSRALKDDGLIVATFVLGRRDPVEDRWVYPGCVTFRPGTVRRIAAEAGLVSARIPWFHPSRQTWYLMARRANSRRLPTPRQRRFLKGTVLNDPEFAESCSPRLSRIRVALTTFVKRVLPDRAYQKLRSSLKS
ncbi:MAG: class I SAM-dependent methyltransferase, partial [Isosphaeraceae bacterium]